MTKTEKYRLIRRLLEISVMDIVRALDEKPNYAHVIYRFEQGNAVRYQQAIEDTYEHLFEEKIDGDSNLIKIVEFIKNM